MRRALVLTNEGRRHWLRSSLPSRRKLFSDLLPDGTTDWRLSLSDVRGVTTVYFATFAAVLAFII
ncbi:hypothetical protein E3U23_12185 [Erythrobacter litoralis]|nr:hypothetical protein [Erythrobacter litoralis]